MDDFPMALTLTMGNHMKWWLPAVPISRQRIYQGQGHKFSTKS